MTETAKDPPKKEKKKKTKKKEEKKKTENERRRDAWLASKDTIEQYLPTIGEGDEHTDANVKFKTALITLQLQGKITEQDVTELFGDALEFKKQSDLYDSMSPIRSDPSVSFFTGEKDDGMTPLREDIIQENRDIYEARRAQAEAERAQAVQEAGGEEAYAMKVKLERELDIIQQVKPLREIVPADGLVNQFLFDAANVDIEAELKQALAEQQIIDAIKKIDPNAPLEPQNYRNRFNSLKYEDNLAKDKIYSIGEKWVEAWRRHRRFKSKQEKQSDEYKARKGYIENHIRQIHWLLKQKYGESDSYLNRKFFEDIDADLYRNQGYSLRYNENERQDEWEKQWTATDVDEIKHHTI